MPDPTAGPRIRTLFAAGKLPPRGGGPLTPGVYRVVEPIPALGAERSDNLVAEENGELYLTRKLSHHMEEAERYLGRHLVALRPALLVVRGGAR